MSARMSAPETLWCVRAISSIWRICSSLSGMQSRRFVTEVRSQLLQNSLVVARRFPNSEASLALRSHLADVVGQAAELEQIGFLWAERRDIAGELSPNRPDRVAMGPTTARRCSLPSRRSAIADLERSSALDDS